MPFCFNTKKKGIDLVCNFNRFYSIQLSIVVRYESIPYIGPFYRVDYANGSIKLLAWKGDPTRGIKPKKSTTTNAVTTTRTDIATITHAVIPTTTTTTAVVPNATTTNVAIPNPTTDTTNTGTTITIADYTNTSTITIPIDGDIDGAFFQLEADDNDLYQVKDVSSKGVIAQRVFPSNVEPIVISKLNLDRIKTLGNNYNLNNI
jgi:hypothetical protein